MPDRDFYWNRDEDFDDGHGGGLKASRRLPHWTDQVYRNMPLEEAEHRARQDRKACRDDEE